MSHLLLLLLTNRTLLVFVAGILFILPQFFARGGPFCVLKIQQLVVTTRSHKGVLNEG